MAEISATDAVSALKYENGRDVNTSYAGRQNLTMRIGVRHFARLTTEPKANPQLRAWRFGAALEVEDIVKLLD